MVKRLTVAVHLLYLLLLGVVSPAGAQSEGVIAAQATQRLTIQSRILAERRIVDVTLPHRYDSDTSARYPVVVTLDGEFNGEVTAAIARYYQAAGALPGLIVVAVHNLGAHRTRDLTPPDVPPFVAPSHEPSGKADRFRSFLANEVLPLIDSTHRTAPMRVLVGHSLGGLFALETLTKQPELFSGFIVLEPSTWWNNELPLEAARHALTQPANRRSRVILVNAPWLSRDTGGWGGDRPMIRNARVGGESHQSMGAVGTAMGLRLLFEDFLPPRWRPGSAPIDMLTRYDSLRARVGYPVPIPATAYALVVRMSLDSRFFDDAERALAQMERRTGVTPQTRNLRARLERERNQPAPEGFIPLRFPPERPTATQTARFLGRWRSVDADAPHEVAIRRSGDTIVVHDRIVYRGGEPFDADSPVIQITPDGTLEWGLAIYRGIAALMVQQAALVDDDTMVVRSEPRGWVHRGPDWDRTRVVRFRRLPDRDTSS